jgi:hypothetical protein
MNAVVPARTDDDVGFLGHIPDVSVVSRPKRIFDRVETAGSVLRNAKTLVIVRTWQILPETGNSFSVDCLRISELVRQCSKFVFGSECRKFDTKIVKSFESTVLLPSKSSAPR